MMIGLWFVVILLALLVLADHAPVDLGSLEGRRDPAPSVLTEGCRR